MIRTKLSDYKTQIETIYTEDSAVEIEIRSMLSREFKEALSEYSEVIQHAKDNDIALEVVEQVDRGLGIVVDKTTPSEYASKAMAILISSLVVSWPLDSDIKQDLLDSPEVLSLIDVTASELAKEFGRKKKT